MHNPFMIYLWFYFGSLILFAAGGALFIVTKILDKSNNIGDSYGMFDDHSRSVIYEEAPRSDIGLEEGRRYLVTFGDNPFEESDNSKAPEALKKNDDIYGELEDVDIPLFKPLQQ